MKTRRAGVAWVPARRDLPVCGAKPTARERHPAAPVDERPGARLDFRETARR